MKSEFKNKIINGDSLEELKKIPSETFDLIFADPRPACQAPQKIKRNACPSRPVAQENQCKIPCF